MHPLVSIIVPNYNHQNYLKQRLDSILNQTFQDFEIIIFDDASTDESLKVLEKYKNNSKVSHFITNIKNSGSPFAQWEKGVELAKGKFIWIAETDDFAEINFLEETINLIQVDNEIGLVYTDSKIIDDNDNEISSWSLKKDSFFKTNKWSKDYIIKGKEEILNYLLYKVTINNVSAVLFRRQELEKINFSKLKSYKNVGDLYVYLSICLKNKIAYISMPLNNYREHQFNATKINSRTGKLYTERIDCFSFFLSKIDALIKNKTEKKKLKNGYKYFLLKNGFVLCDLNESAVFFLFIHKIRKYKLFSLFELLLLESLYRIYSFRKGKIKGASKKMIKLLLKN